MDIYGIVAIMKRKMLDICLNIAIKHLSKHTEPYCHFSFIIHKNQVIEWGTNRRGSPLTFLGYPSYSKIHSEVDAYLKGKGLLKKASFDVINIRMTRSGKLLRNAGPCKNCYEFLKGMGCRYIWFSTDLGNFARMR